MPKGSLENHLFLRGLGLTMSWETTINVAIGVATGLLFLHNRDPNLIHGNVKPLSILLDRDFSAKLSGFTSAKTRPFDPRSRLGAWSPGRCPSPPSPRCRLPNGYDAPEYRDRWRLPNGYDAPEYRDRAKCDVYSFGVILLELLYGHPAVDKPKIVVDKNLVDWAKPYMGDKRKLYRITDFKLDGQYLMQQAYTVVTLAWQCMNSDPRQRPHMEEVLGALEKVQNNKQRSPSLSFPKPLQNDLSGGFTLG